MTSMLVSRKSKRDSFFTPLVPSFTADVRWSDSIFRTFTSSSFAFLQQGLGLPSCAGESLRLPLRGVKLQARIGERGAVRLAEGPRKPRLRERGAVRLDEGRRELRAQIGEREAVRLAEGPRELRARIGEREAVRLAKGPRESWPWLCEGGVLRLAERRRESSSLEDVASPNPRSPRVPLLPPDRFDGDLIPIELSLSGTPMSDDVSFAIHLPRGLPFLPRLVKGLLTLSLSGAPMSDDVSFAIHLPRGLPFLSPVVEGLLTVSRLDNDSSFVPLVAPVPSAAAAPDSCFPRLLIAFCVPTAVAPFQPCFPFFPCTVTPSPLVEGLSTLGEWTLTWQCGGRIPVTL